MQPLALWERNAYYIFRICVYSFSYTAGNVHAPYYNPWPVRLYNIFPHYLINGTIFF